MPETSTPEPAAAGAGAPLRLAVIIGSTRQGRFGPTVANWFAGRAAAREDLDVDLIDLAEAPLPALGHGPGSVRAGAQIAPRLAAADAFVVVTPEYNHSFPAPLKNAIDAHNQEWHAKPVGFVSYGGISGGLRAVEQLRPVFAELHAVTVRATVSFSNPWDRFADDGRPLRPEDCEGPAKYLLDQITWWAIALRNARAAHPYAS
ncbi:NAD(P)H-dependent oxidoreductase [Streptomyces sp. MTZ3.1]|uniref:NAD(P)H-dependent oxidoreductase n=2 Tax=Streptomyces meridianus TaxID=2938945 RepID=A0ABT0X836_9ACTN|nr:NAD(P)H-dependent oxidoreductase [Streptomyces meridianus]MCM2578695.1 NAD(P)H-dependent oxidoreductase [Streptomyces meridianus]